MIELYTIGFTKKSAKEFFELLQKNKVSKIVDTRISHNSQLAGFAKSRDLAFFAETIGGVNHSITFVKVEHPHFYIEAPYFDRQLRVKFTFNDHVYDLAVTDLDFYEQFEADKAILAAAEHIYFSISLGVAYRERHYKIVAGVLWV